MSEEELAKMAEQRFHEQTLQILAELPPVKVSHGGMTWETDVSLRFPPASLLCPHFLSLGRGLTETFQLANHHKLMWTLRESTLRAQSAARHAGVVLADAEVERIGAGERRKVVDAQLIAGSLGVSVGILGV